MTNIWKRSLSLFLAFVMVFGMIPVNAFAVEEELVEEVLVEELIEEEIIEEEILEEELVEEEVFEEEVFEEEEIEEEPAEVTVEEYHAADELANEVAALPETEGTVWVDGSDYIGQMEGLLNDGLIKTTILDSLFNGAAYTEEEYLVEYRWTYTDEDLGIDISRSDDVTSDDFTNEETGSALVLLAELMDASPKTATFYVNDEAVQITFKDQRYSSIKIELPQAFEIANKGALTWAQVTEKVNAWIADNLKVTAYDPVNDVRVDLEQSVCDVEINCYDEDGNYCDLQWPEANTESECVEVYVSVLDTVAFNMDKVVEDLAYGTLKDVRSIYEVTYVTYYAWDYDFEEEPATSDTYYVAENDSTPVHAPVMENMEYYTLSDWDPTPAETVTADAEYVAVWSPILDENSNDEADEVERFTIRFYDGNTKIGELKNVKWGDTEKIQEKVDEMKADGKLDKDKMFFAGWSLEKNSEEVIELPDAVTAPEDGNTWNYYGVWTDNYVVKFAAPTAGERNSDGIAYNKIGKTVMVESDNETSVNEALEAIGEDLADIDWGVKVLGWKVLGETEPYDFNDAVTTNLTLIPMVDSNNNGVEDGTAADPIYTHTWYNQNTEAIKTAYLLKSEAAPKVPFPQVENDDRTVIDWTTEERSTYVFYNVVEEDDRNNNEVDDTLETVTVTKGHTEEGYATGAVYIDGEAVLGEVPYNSKLEKNIVTVKPAMKEDGTSGAYVSSIKVNDQEIELDYNDDFTVTFELNGAKNIDVLYTIAYLDTYHGEMGTTNRGYTAEAVYAAAVKSPAYTDDAEISAEYLAREYNPDLTVDLSVLPEIVNGAIGKLTTVFSPNEIDRGLAEFNRQFAAATVNGEYPYPYEEELWVDVENCGYIEELDAEKVAQQWIEDTQNTASNNPRDLIKGVDTSGEIEDIVASLFNKLMGELDALLADTGMHRFGESADASDEKTEDVRISYKDEKQYLHGETTVTLIENRVATTISASNKEMTYTGNAVDEAWLLNGIAVKAEGETVSTDVELVTDISGIVNAGTYKITVKFNAQDIGEISYLDSEKTFTLTIKPAASGITLPEQIVVQQGTSYKAEPTTNGAEFIHVMAGIDMDAITLNTNKVDLAAGKVVEELTAKAWIKLPQRIVDMIAQVNEKLDADKQIKLIDKKYSLDELKSLLTGYEDAFELAGVPKSAVQGIVDKLEKVRSLTAVTDKLNMPNPQVEVVFVDSETDSQGPDADKIGMYINMGVVIDPNYTLDTASGILLIHPGAALPNKGIQLVYNNAAENLFESYANGEAVALSVQFKGQTVDCPVQYYGISNYAEPLFGQTAPTDAGLYIATAAYTDAEGTVHTDAAVIAIAPNASNIVVAGEVIKADGEAHKPAVTVTKGAAYTMISAEADLSAKEVTVNIDMPAKAKSLLNKVLDKIGYTMPEDVTLQQLVDKLAIVTNATDKIESLIPMETLTELGVPTAKVESVLNKVDTYVETLYTQLTDLMAKVGADVVVTFEHNKTYSKPGVYYFMGIVTDPDFMPYANAGYLVIENAQFAAEDKIITEKEAGDGYELKPTDNAGRGYLTMIKTAKGLNLLIDGNEEQAVIDKIEKKFNITLDGGKVTIDQLVAKGDDWAEKMAEVITDTIREKATAKINGHELIVKVRDIALDIMEKGLDKVEAKIADKIKSIAAPYGNKTIAINGALPKDIGKYEFHFLSYAVAYESATLEIVDDLFKLHAANMKLGDTLDMFFYVKKADLVGTDYYAVVTRTYANGKADDVRTIPYSEWQDYNSSLWRFGYDKLAAKEMTDEIYITVYHGDGTPASYEWIDSIQLYADRMLNPEPPKTEQPAVVQRLMVDMLNYGTEAQHQFHYNESDLADALLSEADKALTIGDVQCNDYRVKSDNCAGSTVVTESSLIFNLVFAGIDKTCTATISYTDHYGNEKNYNIDGSKFTNKGSYLVVSVTGLSVADGRGLVTCDIKDASGNLVGSITDSIESYAARNNSVKVAYELLQFADSAYAYFRYNESLKK